MLVRSVVIIYLVFSYSSIFFLTNIIKWNYLAKIMIFLEFGKKNKKKLYKIVQIVVQQCFFVDSRCYSRAKAVEKVTLDDEACCE